MTNSSANAGHTLRLIEWITAMIGAANCVVVAMVFAQPFRQSFPVPMLYFIELALMGLLVVGFVAARPRLPASRNAIPWIAAGITLAFVILGGFSIGFFLIPAFIGFTLTGLLADWQTGGLRAGHIGVALLAAVAQGALMALLIMFA